MNRTWHHSGCFHGDINTFWHNSCRICWLGGLSIFFKCQCHGCFNNSNIQNLGLCTACWTHFMCHHQLWPTSVSHPFSFLTSSLGFAAGKHYKIITIPCFWTCLPKLCLFQVVFLISEIIDCTWSIISAYTLCCSIISPYTLSVQLQ